MDVGAPVGGVVGLLSGPQSRVTNRRADSTAITERLKGR